MSKEPGQLAFEAYRSRVKTLATMPWAACAEGRKADWAAVESAIRADERAKVREECAKLCETGVDMQHPIIRSHTMKAFHKSPTLAAAIRALGEKNG